jgi:LysR family transcriptional regulator, glycine cleavage system transcriptional activator
VRKIHNTPPSLPPLQSLRVLESAVRLEGYSAAGHELGLTHAAVSRQIRTLEGRVGATLFIRSGRHMKPTERARILVTQTREALAILGSAFGHPVIRPAPQALRLTTTISIARLWLIPRLARLAETDSRLVGAIHTTTVLEAEWCDADAALRYGPGRWPGVEAVRLGGEQLFPVAHPRIAAAAHDWRRAPLIRTPYQSWRPWFQAVGLAAPAGTDSGLEVADAGLALDAARAGLGVALGRGRLAQAALETGELVRVSDREVQDQYAYFLVSPTGPAQHPNLPRLREWLTREFASTLIVAKRRPQ